jgi:copper(I)-binding protein
MRTRNPSCVSLFLAALVFPLMSWAGDVKIDHAWIRATAPGQNVAGAFMKITADRDMELVAGTTPRADHVELHSMRMDNGMMEMRELESIKLPKGKTVSLELGGMHAMLIGLTSQIKVGDKVPMTLTFRGGKGKQENISITLDVIAPGH